MLQNMRHGHAACSCPRRAMPAVPGALLVPKSGQEGGLIPAPHPAPCSHSGRWHRHGQRRMGSSMSSMAASVGPTPHAAAIYDNPALYSSDDAVRPVLWEHSCKRRGRLGRSKAQAGCKESCQQGDHALRSDRKDNVTLANTFPHTLPQMPPSPCQACFLTPPPQEPASTPVHSAAFLTLSPHCISLTCQLAPAEHAHLHCPDVPPRHAHWSPAPHSAPLGHLD